MIFFFALLTACAGVRNGDKAEIAPVIVGIGQAVIVALHQKKLGDNDGTPATSPPTPTMAMTMTMAPPEPNLNEIASVYAVYRVRDSDTRNFLVVFSVAAEGEDRTILGVSHRFERMRITERSFFGPPLDLNFVTPQFNRMSLHASGDIVPLVDDDGNTVFVPIRDIGDGAGLVMSVAFEGVPSITVGEQLCPVNWLVSFLNAFIPPFCPGASEMSYSPDIGRVVVAAMSDGFRRGVIVGESGFSFSGRYDGENRAAGFAYDFGNFQMRTDYIRLPSKQDSEVWLDTYRLGIIRPLNDETSIFAGVDSYDNAIMAIDINTKSDLQHRLGAAMAKSNKEYAIQYEFRLNL